MRDDGTGPHTLDSSRHKAYTSVSFCISTTDFTRLVETNPAAANLKDIEGVIAVGGGAPVGDRDEACTQAGINRITDRLK